MPICLPEDILRVLFVLLVYACEPTLHSSGRVKTWAYVPTSGVFMLKGCPSGSQSTWSNSRYKTCKLCPRIKDKNWDLSILFIRMRTLPVTCFLSASSRIVKNKDSFGKRRQELCRDIELLTSWLQAYSRMETSFWKNPKWLIVCLAPSTNLLDSFEVSLRAETYSSGL